jgi:P27 family predicted phage terminase small subunit
MTPGPAPKPAGLRIIEGTDSRGRSGRLLDRTREPVAPQGPLEPPYDMGGELREVWDRLAAALKAMHIDSPADVDALATLCEAIVTHRTASRVIRGSAILLKGSRSNWVANKAVAIQRDSAATIRQLAAEFGLTPSARMRVETDPYDGSRVSGPNPFAGRGRPKPFAG